LINTREAPHRWRRLVGRAAVGATVLVLLAACDAPFGLGLPTTRAVESGAGDTLNAATSFRITGSLTDSVGHRTIDLAVVRPTTEHVLLSGGGIDLEAIIVGPDAYFRGPQFLSNHMGSDPLSRSRVRAAGNAWWKGSASNAPQLPDFINGTNLRATFLGAAATTRSDHVAVGGQAAIELSGPRADVFVDEAPPHRLLRLHMKNGAVIDGIAGADLLYSDFDRNFGIVAPSGAIDFADLSTLPPIYTVVSVDTSGCSLTCVVSALLRNLGGRIGALAPSKVTFTMTDPATSTVLGSCMTDVKPDVSYNATTKASCTIDGVNGLDQNAALVTAVAVNPGRA
jgi:hypothetical protein